MSPDTPISSFGSRLKKYRKAQGVSAEALANIVNSEYGDGTTTRSVITAIETGRKNEGITLAEALRFAHALRISPLILIVDCEQPFLAADFPGFDNGIPNYVAQRRFSGEVRFTQPRLPECMATAENVGNALYAAMCARSSICTGLSKLKKIIQQADETQDKEFENAVNIHNYASEICNQWDRFVANRASLVEEGVIIPDHPLGIGRFFTEKGMEKLKAKIAPYEKYAEKPIYDPDEEHAYDEELDL